MVHVRQDNAHDWEKRALSLLTVVPGVGIVVLLLVLLGQIIFF